MADLDRDGDLDLVVANTNSGIQLLTGNGAGSFTASSTLSLGGGLPNMVAVADVDGDGLPDIVTAKSNDAVSVHFGSGGGGFAAVKNFAAGGAPSSVALGDLDRDGDLDLVVGNSTSDNVSVLLGK